VDRYETLVFQYLKSLDIGKVVFEPDGPYTFPDFSVGGNIAVEATRLVKHLEDCGDTLETIYPGMHASLRNAIESVAQDQFSVSRYVSLNISLPIDRISASRALKRFLIKIAEYPLHECDYIEVFEGLRARVNLAGRKQGTPFSLGIVNSPQFSGWVASEILDQCVQAIHKKELRLFGRDRDYKEFWLAVGSHLTIGLNDYTFATVEKDLKVETGFRKLLLIDGTNPAISRMLSLN